MVPELLSLPYSPWSERARFALDVRGVHYVKKHFQPLLGEPALRFRIKKFSGNVTVPVLFTDGGFHTDSLDIAKWANTQGTGPDLFPRDHESDISALHALSESALGAGRGLSLRRVLEDEEALRELVPPKLRSLGGVAIAIARSGVKRTLSKYGAARRAPDEERATLRKALEDLRSFISKSTTRQGEKARPLFGELSFGDITASQALSFVVPPVHSSYRIGAASRRAFEDPDMKREFSDVVAWRDALYASYRSP